MEEKVAQEGIELNDSQIAALEKKKYDDEACGEIDTAHPGYLGSQDTFYVGNLKRISTTGLITIIMNELIREKCAVVELPWKHYLMENKSGKRKI